MAQISDVYSVMIEVVGFEATLKLAELFEGESVFFKKLESAERPSRNRRILEEFNGYNFSYLAKKYKLTPNAIRAICKDKIEAKRNAPEEGQISFFK